MSAHGSKRDVTRALAIVAHLSGLVRMFALVDLDELADLLKRMDARTGKRDPSLRKGFRPAKSDPKRSPARKVAAKAKKRAR